MSLRLLYFDASFCALGELTFTGQGVHSKGLVPHCREGVDNGSALVACGTSDEDILRHD
jgi:hypothetical protein